MLKIGITGGIGSGKSLISRIFSTIGVPVYNADSQAKHLMNNDPALQQKIREHFGEESYNREGELNRQYLSFVFGDPQKLALLNSFVHPAVGLDFEIWSSGFSNQPYVLKEAALLFESGSYRKLDKTITVFASPELRIERVKKRDPFRSEDQIVEIMKRQMPEEEKIRLADLVIFNDEKQLVIPQVLHVHQGFSKD